MTGASGFESELKVVEKMEFRCFEIKASFSSQNTFLKIKKEDTQTNIFLRGYQVVGYSPYYLGHNQPHLANSLLPH